MYINRALSILLLLNYSFMLLLQKYVIHLHAKPFNLNYHHHLLDYYDSAAAAASDVSELDDTNENNYFDNNADNDNNLRNVNNQSTHFSIVVQFIPSLVHVTVLENATANTNVPIAIIRANISLTHLDSSNQIRSQNILSSKNQLYQIEYHLLNHLDFFTINKKSGEIYLKSTLSNFTYIVDVRANILASPSIQSSYLTTDTFNSSTQIGYSTKVPVYIELKDINNNEPEPKKNVLDCLAYDDIDISTPICTALFKDADRGINAELSYSFVSDDLQDDNGGESNNLRIDPKTGSIYRRYANRSLLPGDYSETIVATDHGVPYLETSINSKFKILNSTITRKKNFNEKPDILAKVKDIVLTGSEVIGDTIINLVPIDPDKDDVAVHIVAGDAKALFTIDNGIIVLAKDIDFSERKTFNLSLMLTDGSEKNYLNVLIIIPELTREIPNKFNTTSISMFNDAIATEGSHLINISRYAYNTSYAKYKLYSASSYDASNMFEVNEYTGQVSLAMKIDFQYNGRHILIFSIEDNRFSSDHYRSFLELIVNVNLNVPYVPTTSTTTIRPTSTTRLSPPPTTITTTISTTPTTTTSTTTTTTTTTTSATTTKPTTSATTSSPTTITTTPKPFSSFTTTTITSRPLLPSTIPSTTTTITTSPPITSSSTTLPPATQYFPSSFVPYDPSAFDIPNLSTRFPPWTQYPYQPPPTFAPPHDPFHPYPPLRPKPPAYPPFEPPPDPTLLPPPPPLPPTSLDTIPVTTLVKIVLGLMAVLFFLACTCLFCRCCCRSPRSKRYRDKNDTLLNRSSFHSQQRLHSHHRSQSPNINGSMSRNMSSRLSLRTSAHATPTSTRGIQSKYGAGDSVSLSAMNERAKHKPLLLPPSPAINQNHSILNEADEGLYENAFGPGHPQYLNELRRLKPDFSRMSSHLLANRRQASTSTVNSSINPRIQQSVANSQTNESTPSKWGQTFTRKKDSSSPINGINSNSSEISNGDGSYKSDEFSSENHLSPTASDSCQVRIIEQTQQITQEHRNRAQNPTSSEGDQSDSEASDSSRLEY